MINLLSTCPSTIKQSEDVYTYSLTQKTAEQILQDFGIEYEIIPLSEGQYTIILMDMNDTKKLIEEGVHVFIWSDGNPEPY